MQHWPHRVMASRRVLQTKAEKDQSNFSQPWKNPETAPQNRPVLTCEKWPVQSPEGERKAPPYSLQRAGGGVGVGRGGQQAEPRAAAASTNQGSIPMTCHLLSAWCYAHMTKSSSHHPHVTDESAKAWCSPATLPRVTASQCSPLPPYKDPWEKSQQAPGGTKGRKPNDLPSRAGPWVPGQEYKAEQSRRQQGLESKQRQEPDVLLEIHKRNFSYCFREMFPGCNSLI